MSVSKKVTYVTSKGTEFSEKAKAEQADTEEQFYKRYNASPLKLINNSAGLGEVIRPPGEDMLKWLRTNRFMVNNLLVPEVPEITRQDPYYVQAFVEHTPSDPTAFTTIHEPNEEEVPSGYGIFDSRSCRMINRRYAESKAKEYCAELVKHRAEEGSLILEQVL